MPYPLKEKINHILDKEFFVDEKALFFRLKELFAELEPQFLNEIKTKKISEISSSFLEKLEKQENTTIYTEFRDFDKDCNLSLGEFVVIGARPAMGKTQLITQFATNISEKIPTLFFSLDLSETQLISRILSHKMNIPAERLLRGDLDNKNWQKLFKSFGELENSNLYISNLYTGSLSMFRKECQKYIEEKGVKIIFIDCLQQMAFSRKWGHRELEIASICKELKSIAKDFNVCIVATSQLSRSVEAQAGHKRPQLSHLRESGSIEELADKVLFIYRPEYYKLDTWEDDTPSAGQAELILAKNNSGFLADIRLNFHQGRFGNIYESLSYGYFSTERLSEINHILEIDDDYPF